MDWRTVWHKGLAPQFTDAELASLRDALLRYDPRLIAGQTVRPAGPDNWPRPAEACCAVCYPKMTDGASVLDLGMWFEQAARTADRLTGTRYEAVGVFTAFFDGTAPTYSFPLLAAEVVLDLEARAGK